MAEVKKMKRADGLKQLRRMTLYHVIDQRTTKFGTYNKVADEKKPILSRVEMYEQMAEEWGIKLPKDFAKQAEEYQAKLDQAIKEYKEREA